MASLPVFYDCGKCPAYCCSYPRIPATAADIRRLARFFELPYETARETLTKRGEGSRERVLRHRQDYIYDSVCRFLDQETRACTVYDARPAICRRYPGSTRCGYYDFLSFERRAQDDPDFIPSA